MSLENWHQEREDKRPGEEKEKEGKIVDCLQDCLFVTTLHWVLSFIKLSLKLSPRPFKLVSVHFSIASHCLLTGMNPWKSFLGQHRCIYGPPFPRASSFFLIAPFFSLSFFSYYCRTGELKIKLLIYWEDMSSFFLFLPNFLMHKTTNVWEKEKKNL